MLPALKKAADNHEDLLMYAAIAAILKIEGVSPYDKENEYAKMARAGIAKAKSRHAKETRRMSTTEYAVLEDLDAKKSDSGALRAGDRFISMYERVFYDE